MAGEVMSTLELQVEANANKALVALELLGKKLTSIGNALDEVNSKAKGLSNFSKSKITLIFKDVATSAKNAEKAIDNVNRKKVAPKADDSAAKALAQTFEEVKKKMTLDDVVGRKNPFQTMQRQLPAIVTSIEDRLLPETKAAIDSAKRLGDQLKAAADAPNFDKDSLQADELKETMKEAADAAEQLTAKRQKILDAYAGGARRASTLFGTQSTEEIKEASQAMSEFERNIQAAGGMRKFAEDNGLTIKELQKFIDVDKGAKGAFIAHKEAAEQAAEATREQAAAEEQAANAAQKHASVMGTISGAFGEIKSVFSTVGNGFKRVGSFFRTVGGYAGTAVGGLKRFANAMIHPIRSMKQLLGLDTQVRRRGGLLGSRTLGQYVGLIAFRRAITAMIRALVGGIKEGMQNLAQYSASFNNSISSMHSGLIYLKNAWAAAFAPIVNVVAPYITAFINMLATALNAIGRFLAAITGKGFAVQAKPVWEDYAASLDKTGKSGSSAGKGIDKATKAAEDYKKTIMGFDQLHVLNAPDESSGSGSGGSGGGGSGSGLNVSDMFTTTSIEGSLKDFANKIRDAIADGDWYKVGSIIAEKLNEQVDKLNGKWPDIEKKCKGVAEKVGNTINGFVEKFNWSNLGKAVAGGINTALGTANTFLTTVHWDSIGKAIGNFIGGAIENIRWNEVGDFAANTWNALWKTLNNAAKTIPWASLGSGIGTSIVNFLKKADFRSAGEFVHNLFTGIATTIDEMLNTSNDLDGLGDKIADFITGALGDGKSSGMISSVGRLLSAIAKQLSEAFSRPDVKLAIYKFGHDVGQQLAKLPWKQILSDFLKVLINTIVTGLSGLGAAIVEEYPWLAPAAGLFKGTGAITKSSAYGKGQNTPEQETAKNTKGIFDLFKKPNGATTSTVTGGTAGVGVGLGTGLGGSAVLELGAKLLPGAKKNIETYEAVESDTAIKTLRETGGSKVTTFYKNTWSKLINGSANKNVTATVGSSFTNAMNKFNNSLATGVWKKSATSTKTVKATTAASYTNATKSFNNSNKSSVWKQSATAIKNIGASFLSGYTDALNSYNNSNARSVWAASATSRKTVDAAETQNYQNASKSFSGWSDKTVRIKVTVPIMDFYWSYHQDPNGNYSYYPSYFTRGTQTFARGGILDWPTQLGVLNGRNIIAGEAGREAILPLDNNTAWMGKFASKVSDNVSATMNANIEKAITSAVSAAMMASSGGGDIIENHITIKTQNDEVLARAVERGNAKRRYRTGVALA